ncbi:MAG: hypothetical protein EGR45_05180 [Ruminococcaceae bacterium]|jgi:hypothetical protein|nr:hypothetical protein [Oscillospiraceae bacterium]
MADRQGVGIAYIVSLCGIMSGLAVAMMFCLGMIPGFEYVSPMVAGVLVWIVRERLGVRYGMACFAAVGLLTMLFTANYEASMMFIFLLGYYPIVRQYIMKLKAAVLRWGVKLALYAVAAVSCYFVLINLFGMDKLLEDMGEFGQYGQWVLLGLGAAAFVMYDLFLGLFFPFYEKVLKPKISKRMK